MSTKWPTPTGPSPTSPGSNGHCMRSNLIEGPLGVTIHDNIRPGWDCEKCPVAEARVEKVKQLIAKLKPFAAQETKAEWGQTYFIPRLALDHEPGRTIFTDYHALLVEMDETESQCRYKSEEIITDGTVVGIYCPSTNQDHYYEH